MEEESTSGCEVCSGDYYSGSSDSDEYVDCERQCPVCSEWHTYFPGKACPGCTEFFEQCVRNFEEPICYTSENYCDNKNQKRYCNCCRLNRCYKVGMRVIDVYEYLDDYINALRVRLNEGCQGRKLDNGVRWMKAQEEFYDLRDSFHNWICCFSDFQTLRRCDQVRML
ncbi:estrogen receptor beta-like [Centruroides sculpturatus]|uniref:estrogen receptor beta-like n=1 Tax=Centruroides sculpturatus TaxID=218467 RepID=UPI000C6D78DF|nr:estrogen receptor beta-like [Centruroides sculpturatus]